MGQNLIESSKRGDWNIVVDADGSVLTTDPRPDDVLARPPINVYFAGTSEAEAANAAKNEAAFEKAIFEISQTDTGRALLKFATSQGCVFRFDDQACDKKGVGAFYSYNFTEIVLSSRYTPRQLAMAIVHETKHAHQLNACGFIPLHFLLPTEQLKSIALKEADARIAELWVAYELQHGAQNGPANQYRSDFMVRELTIKLPEMAQAADDYAQANQGRLGSMSAFAAHVFPSYFEMKGILEFYEALFHEHMTQRPLGAIQDPNQLSLVLPNEQILKPLQTVDGTAYMEVHPNNFDLSDPRYSEISEATARDMASLQRTRRLMNRDLRGEEDWSFNIRPKEGRFQSLIKAARNLFTSSRAMAGQMAEEMPHTQETGPKLVEAFVIPAAHRIHDPRGTKGNVSVMEEFRKRLENGTMQHLDRLTQSDLTMQGMNRDFTRGFANGIGTAFLLVQGGFRAPISAFQEEYLHDFARKIEKATPDTLEELTNYERELVEHWISLEKSDIGMRLGSVEGVTEEFSQIGGTDLWLETHIRDVIMPVYEPPRIIRIERPLIAGNDVSLGQPS